MNEINRGDTESSDKTKNKRGLLFAAALVTLFIGVLALNHGCDSSAYTFNPERINRIGLSIAAAVIAVGVAIYFIFFRKK